ncbi:MAG TPA: hypothetical protein VIP77_24350, partial [Jiangellaceae bacterium]
MTPPTPPAQPSRPARSSPPIRPTPPVVTPDPVALAEVRLSLLGVLAPTLDLTVSADQAAQARQARQLVIADAEGAPVADLDLDLDDTTTADTAVRGTVRGPATTTTAPHADSPGGPYAWLRLRPHEGRLDGAAAIRTARSSSRASPYCGAGTTITSAVVPADRRSSRRESALVVTSAE